MSFTSDSFLTHREVREGIVATCLAMNASGLNQGTSGNVSHRVPGGMLVTPTSLPYEQMTAEDVVEVAFDGSFAGARRPSSEWRFHRDILQAREDVNVVVHTHSVHCAALAVHERHIPPFHYMVAVAGGHDIRCSPYERFGTQALSDVALAALEGRKACLLGHHGLIACGKTFDNALWLAAEVETLARMYLLACALGEPPLLSLEEIGKVREQMSLMSYGKAPDLNATAA